MIRVGQMVEILPGYNVATGCRDQWDEVAGCEARIVQVEGREVKVEISGWGEVWWVAASRLRLPPAASVELGRPLLISSPSRGRLVAE